MSRADVRDGLAGLPPFRIAVFDGEYFQLEFQQIVIDCSFKDDYTI